MNAKEASALMQKAAAKVVEGMEFLKLPPKQPAPLGKSDSVEDNKKEARRV
jgi:hypothetical protein